MYPPQVAEHISIELEGYQHQFVRLQTTVNPLIPDISIEEQLQHLKLSNTSKSPDHYAKLHKWYIECNNQIKRNIHELAHELKRPESPFL